jgi:hypothetical protein
VPAARVAVRRSTEPAAIWLNATSIVPARVMVLSTAAAIASVIAVAPLNSCMVLPAPAPASLRTETSSTSMVSVIVRSMLLVAASGHLDDERRDHAGHEGPVAADRSQEASD